MVTGMTNGQSVHRSHKWWNGDTESECFELLQGWELSGYSKCCCNGAIVVVTRCDHLCVLNVLVANVVCVVLCFPNVF